MGACCCPRIRSCFVFFVVSVRHSVGVRCRWSRKVLRFFGAFFIPVEDSCIMCACQNSRPQPFRSTLKHHLLFGSMLFAHCVHRCKSKCVIEGGDNLCPI